MVRQRFNKRIKHMNRFLKYILLSLVFISASLFASGVQAADPLLGDFKCSTFTTVGKKLAIFRMSLVEQTNGTPNFDPTSGSFFCVELSESATVAEWPDLIKGKDQNGSVVINRNWNIKDVRAQYRDVCPNVTGDWNTFGFDSDHKPQDGTYELSRSIEYTCAGGSPTYEARRRYYFNDLGSPIDEVFVFFIKIAEDGEQQPNPIPICAQKDGTSKSVCEAVSGCLWQVAGAKCFAKADPEINCTQLPPDVCSAANYCTPGENNTCVPKAIQVEVDKAIDNYIAERYDMPKDYKGPLPKCAFTGSCRNVEDLVQLGVNEANWLFGIIAGLGFAFFVYGGLTMVLSFGNSEKVGQGKQILVAATVGMIIAFSAYVLVSFIVKAIGINPNLSPF